MTRRPPRPRPRNRSATRWRSRPRSSSRSPARSRPRPSPARSISTRRPSGPSSAISSQDGVTRYSFSPKRMLLPDVAYRLTVSGVRDTDGLPLDTVVLAVRTAKAAGVVRFRPLNGTTGVARDAAISVRFSEAMDRRSTAARVLRVGRWQGRRRAPSAWAEHDTVLVFTPRSALPAGSSVVDGRRPRRRGTRAAPRSSSPSHGAFKTAATTQTRPRRQHPRGSGGSGGGGGAVGGGSWAVGRDLLPRA